MDAYMDVAYIDRFNPIQSSWFDPNDLIRLAIFGPI